MCQTGDEENSVPFVLYVQSCRLHVDRFVLLLERPKHCKGLAGCIEEMNSLEKRRLHVDFIVAFQYLKGAYNKDGDRLFNNRKKGDAFKLKESRFRLDIRKKESKTTELRA